MVEGNKAPWMSIFFLAKMPGFIPNISSWKDQEVTGDMKKQQSEPLESRLDKNELEKSNVWLNISFMQNKYVSA